MAPAIGIDLGTSYSCVGVYKADGVELIADCQGIRTIPSYVAFTETERLIGGAARNQVARNPRNTVFDVKRLIGRKYNDPSVQEDMRRWPFTVKADSNGKAVIEVEVKGKKRIIHPEEISAMILGKMKKIAEAHIGQEVTEAVITVPAYFNQAQRQATKDAGRIAGFNGIDLINEPSAAALAYAYNKQHDKADETNVLIFNLGGGTLDASIVTIDEGVIEVKATAGDTHLGGGDFDNRLVDYCVQDIKERHGVDLCTNAWCSNAGAVRRLRTACESAKRTLSSDTKASIDIDGLLDGKDYSITITRDRFEKLCISDFGKCLRPIDQVLRDAGIKKSQLDKIILVGGSTCIPMIQQLIREFIPNGPCHFITPAEAVAYGAAIQAAIFTASDNAKLKGLSILDVNPLSVGVQTPNGVSEKIIERNTTILMEERRTYKTHSDNQTSLSIRLFEGEGQMAADNNLIATFHFGGILPAPRGVPEIEVRFEFDRDGILNVSAAERDRNKLTVTKEDVVSLSERKIDRMIEKAEKIRAEDEASDRMRHEARKGFEDYICQMKNNLIKKCDAVQSWLDSNPQAEKAAYNAKQKEVEDIFSPILMRMHQPVTRGEGGTGDSSTGGSSGPTV